MSELIANRYELGSVVGSGGMSVVYSATDTLLGREVAVKMLRSELARDANFRERFRREAQNAGRLNHPAIVAIYDTGETLHNDQSTPIYCDGAGQRPESERHRGRRRAAQPRRGRNNTHPRV